MKTKEEGRMELLLTHPFLLVHKMTKIAEISNLEGLF